MLYIGFRQIYNQNNIADYEVTVHVNTQLIAPKFIVKNHDRDDGWFQLLKQFIHQWENGNG